MGFNAGSTSRRWAMSLARQTSDAESICFADAISAVSVGEVDTATCCVCNTPFVVADNLNSATTEPSETGYRQRFGRRLFCPLAHACCTDCFSLYVRRKLDRAKPGEKTLPLPCPSCPTGTHLNITDDEAFRSLPDDLMVRWVGVFDDFLS